MAFFWLPRRRISTTRRSSRLSRISGRRVAGQGRRREQDVVAEPGRFEQIYDEQVAFYADSVARTGEEKITVTPVTGVGEAAQKIRVAYAADDKFLNWIVEARQGEVFVRAVSDVAGGGTEKGDGALVKLVGNILTAAAAMTSS